jgi:energy-converting hydrogenase Eha subunit C
MRIQGLVTACTYSHAAATLAATNTRPVITIIMVLITVVVHLRKKRKKMFAQNTS